MASLIQQCDNIVCNKIATHDGLCQHHWLQWDSQMRRIEAEKAKALKNYPSKSTITGLYRYVQSNKSV